MSTVDPQMLSEVTRRWRVQAQLRWLAGQLFALLVLVGWMWWRKSDYLSVLWTTHVGRTMLIGVAMLLLAYVPSYLGGCLAVNSLLERRWPRQRLVYWLLVKLWTLLGFVVFFLPVVFVIVVAPAAISIQQVMMKR